MTVRLRLLIANAQNNSMHFTGARHSHQITSMTSKVATSWHFPSAETIWYAFLAYIRSSQHTHTGCELRLSQLPGRTTFGCHHTQFVAITIETK